MSGTIPKIVRKEVTKRAGYACEYCRLQERFAFLPFQVDHIISQKHGGGHEISNLAYSCTHCNQYKGTDLTTFLKSYDDIEAIFHPRKHIWSEHFAIVEGEIQAMSRIGEATVKLLRLNQPERWMIRKLLMEKGLYP